jgi:hypothetical protein
MLQAGRSRVRFPMRSLDFFSWPNPSSRTIALGPTQPLTEMSTRNVPGAKGWPARKAENLTAIGEAIVWKMWEPQPLAILCVSTTCYKDSFTFFYWICCYDIRVHICVRVFAYVCVCVCVGECVILPQTDLRSRSAECTKRHSISISVIQSYSCLNTSTYSVQTSNVWSNSSIITVARNRYLLFTVYCRN